MNYIKQLEMERDIATGKFVAIDDKLVSIFSHLSAEKFQGDDPLAGYININDVRTLIQELRDIL